MFIGFYVIIHVKKFFDVVYVSHLYFLSIIDCKIISNVMNEIAHINCRNGLDLDVLSFQAELLN